MEALKTYASNNLDILEFERRRLDKNKQYLLKIKKEDEEIIRDFNGQQDHNERYFADNKKRQIELFHTFLRTFLVGIIITGVFSVGALYLSYYALTSLVTATLLTGASLSVIASSFQTVKEFFIQKRDYGYHRLTKNQEITYNSACIDLDITNKRLDGCQKSLADIIKKIDAIKHPRPQSQPLYMEPELSEDMSSQEHLRYDDSVIPEYPAFYGDDIGPSDTRIIYDDRMIPGDPYDPHHFRGKNRT